MKYTSFASHSSSIGELKSTTDFKTFVDELIKSTKYTECNPCTGHACTEKRTAVYSPAEFKNNKRSKANVLAVHALIYDIDGPTPNAPDGITESKFMALLDRLDKSGVEYAFIATHSYTEAHPSVRLLFSLKRPLMPAEFDTVRQIIQRTLQIPGVDENAKDPSRIYYTPSISKVVASIPNGYTDGDSIDVDLMLKVGQKTKTTIALMPESASVDLNAISKQIPAEISAQLSTGLSRGGRDNNINTIASTLVFKLPPETPADAIYALMRPMLNQTPADSGEDWHVKAKDCIVRAKDRLSMDLAQKEEQKRITLDLLKRTSALSTDSEITEDYTEDQIAQWAIEQGCHSSEEFDRRWIIHQSSAYYIFVDGKYMPPVGDKDLQNTFQRDLARSGIRIFNNDKKNPGPRAASDILNMHGTVARKIEASLSIQKSFYDSRSQTFFEAACPLRPVKPEYNAEIQEWLEIFGPEVVSWVAALSMLDKQCAALYIHGPPNIGKTLLATGLARLWTTGGATPMEDVAEGFSERLVECPLVFADESLPSVDNISTWIRKNIGNTNHTLNRKYLPKVNISGCPRYLITANNSALFDIRQDLTLTDLQAFAERIIYVEVDDKPGRKLEEFRKRGINLNDWITNDTMAAHSLWLALNHKITPGRRYIVEGKHTKFHNSLILNTGIAASVSEWVSRYVVSKAASKQNPRDSVLFGNDMILVSTGAMSDKMQWEEFCPSIKPPTAKKISDTLSRFSNGSVSIDGISYYKVKTEIIEEMINGLKLGNIERAIKAIHDTNDTIAKALS
jgi:hypothetical protein